MVRVLGAIERGGNKMPNPAILFVWLCVIVIILSAAARVGGHQGHLPGRQGASDRRRGGRPGRFHRSRRAASRTRPSRRATTRSSTETAAVQSLLSADGIRFLFTSFVANFRNFAAVAIILVVMLGVGLAEAAGLDRGADPQARQRLVGSAC